MPLQCITSIQYLMSYLPYSAFSGCYYLEIVAMPYENRLDDLLSTPLLSKVIKRVKSLYRIADDQRRWRDHKVREGVGSRNRRHQPPECHVYRRRGLAENVIEQLRRDLQCDRYVM